MNFKELVNRIKQYREDSLANRNVRSSHRQSETKVQNPQNPRNPMTGSSVETKSEEKENDWILHTSGGEMPDVDRPPIDRSILNEMPDSKESPEAGKSSESRDRDKAA